MATPVKPIVVRFGVYDFAVDTLELRKQGMRIRLEGQPAAILKVLLGRPGELITREEMQKALWQGDTFVDFEHSLNAAVKRLRAALNDSADHPRYVETLARRGYRFIAPVKVTTAGEVEAPAPVTAPTARPRWRWLVAVVLCTFAAVGLGWRQWRHRGAIVVPAVRSLAVLPLQNLSGDPSQEYFADGMTEELIGRLSNIQGLRVISRTSAMHFKHTQLSIPDIARQLQVDAIVEGSVIREGNQVRVHAQLIRAVRDEHIWAGEYQREAGSILAVQEDVARNIAERIKGKITPPQKVRARGSDAVDPEAHEDYLRGRYYLNERTPEALNKSIEYFRQAIKREPEYALAYSGMADAYSLLGFRGAFPSKEALLQAKAAALKAIELDESLSEPHASVAFIAETYEWDWARAEREYKRALELNSDDAGAHGWYAGYLMYTGRFDEGIGEARRARELDPLSLPVNNALAGRLLVAQRYDEAFQQVQKTLELNPHFAPAHQTLGWIYLNQGKNAEALHEFQQAVADAGPDNADITLDFAFVQARVGDRKEARKMTLRFKKLHDEGRAPAGAVAILYGALGELDEAFAWLEKAYQERDPELTYLKVPRRRFEPLRGDPRYQQMVQRMHLPQ